jgi:superfamily I DNA/RNA helicase
MKLPNTEELNDEQLEVFMAPLKTDVLVIGPPGTGKTVIALYRAQIIHKKNKNAKFWILMYNRILRRYTENNLDSGSFYGGAEVASRIRTMNSWLWSWGRRWGWRRDWRDFDNLNWIDGIAQLSNKPAQVQKRALSWDHVIIDEGQDFAKGFYMLLQSVKALGLSVEKRLALTVFADENQRLNTDNNCSIEEIRSELNVPGFEEFSLNTNYRNSIQIAELASHFYCGLATGIPNMPLRKGPVNPALRSYADSSMETAQIATFATSNEDLSIGVIVETDAVRRNIYDNLVVRLSGTSVKIYTYHYKLNKEEVEKLEIEDCGSITVVCGASCKGLEFDAVFLPRLESYNPDPSNELVFKMNMYVRVSRARNYLNLSFVSADGGLPEVLNYFPKELLGNCKRDEGLAQPIKFVTENKDAGSASAPQVEGAGKTVKIKGFTVSHYKNSILLKGDTKPLKEDLKSMNGIWFSPQNAWMFAKIRKEELVDFLSQL